MLFPQDKYGMTYKTIAGTLVLKHDLVTFDNDLVSCGNDLLTHGNEILSCGNNLLTRGNNLLFCGNDFLSCRNNLLSCGNDLLSCGNNFLSCGNDLLSHRNEIKKTEENSSMCLPGFCCFPIIIFFLISKR